MSTLSLAYIKEKWLHVGFQKYLKNTGWMFFGRFFTLGISFFVGIYLARYLGPSNYGLLNYVMSFVGLFSFLASFGIEGIVSREIIKDHSKKDELIGTGFYIKIIGSIIAITGVIIVSLFTTRDLFTLGLIWIFSLSFIPQAFGILEIYFQSQVLSKKVVTAQIMSSLVSAALKIMCIVFNKGIFWLIIIYVTETSIYGTTLLFAFRKFGNHIRRWRFNIVIAKTILQDSWPSMITLIAWSIYMKIDQVMIKNMIDNEQAGVYSVAAKLSEVWYFIPGIICSSIFPAIINARKKSYELYKKRLSNLYSLMFWMSLFISIFISTFAYYIILLLFGSQYLGAVTTLQIYIWAGIGVSLNSALAYYLISENETKINAISSIIGALINVTLNYTLIPKYGINGAAFASFMSYTLVSVSILSFGKGRSQISIILNGIMLPFVKISNYAKNSK